MKKPYLLIHTVLLIVIGSPCFVFASNAQFTASLQEEPLTIISLPSTLESESLLANNSPYIELKNTTSEEDLQNFIKTVLSHTIETKTIKVEGDIISVTRDTESKLFGAIPIVAEETILIVTFNNQISDVIVIRPWWNIISKNEMTKDMVSEDILLRIKSIPFLGVESTLELKTQRKIISAVQRVSDVRGAYVLDGIYS